MNHRDFARAVSLHLLDKHGVEVSETKLLGVLADLGLMLAPRQNRTKVEPAREQKSSPFRLLIEGKITVDEYVDDVKRRAGEA